MTFSTLEIVAAIIGFIYLVLEYKASTWLWLFGIISPILYTYATHDSPGAIEGYYATAALSGMGMTPAEYMPAVDAVTLEDVTAAANTLKLHSSFFLKGVQA